MVKTNSTSGQDVSPPVTATTTKKEDPSPIDEAGINKSDEASSSQKLSDPVPPIATPKAKPVNKRSPRTSKMPKSPAGGKMKTFKKRRPGRKSVAPGPAAGTSSTDHEAETSRLKTPPRDEVIDRLITEVIDSVNSKSRPDESPLSTSTPSRKRPVKYTDEWTTEELQRVTDALVKHGASSNALFIIHASVHTSKSMMQVQELLNDVRRGKNYRQYADKSRQPWQQYNRGASKLTAPAKTWVAQIEQMQMERGVEDISEQCISVALTALAKQTDKTFGPSYSVKVSDPVSGKSYRVSYARLYRWLSNVFYNETNMRLPILEPLETAVIKSSLLSVIEQGCTPDMQSRVQRVRALLETYSRAEYGDNNQTAPQVPIDFKSINPLSLANNDLLIGEGADVAPPPQRDAINTTLID